MKNHNKKKLGFFAAMMDFFGKKEGQTSLEFMKEVKELTDLERAQFKGWLSDSGYEIISG